MEQEQIRLHVYQDHLGGGIYLTDSYDKSRLRRCGQCGESDNYLGVATTFEQLLELCRWTTRKKSRMANRNTCFQWTICKKYGHPKHMNGFRLNRTLKSLRYRGLFLLLSTNP